MMRSVPDIRRVRPQQDKMWECENVGNDVVVPKEDQTTAEK